MPPQRSIAVNAICSDTHDLSSAGRGNPEADVRDVQGSVRTEGHTRRELQARGHRGEGAVVPNAYHFARTGSLGAGEASDRVGFQGESYNS